MSIKPRSKVPYLQISIIVLELTVGLWIFLSGQDGAGELLLAIGAITLLVTLLSLRRNSTTFEHILTLTPRDEREAKKIEWGFALVGKIFLVFFVLFGFGLLALWLVPGIFTSTSYVTPDGTIVDPGPEIPWVVPAALEIILGMYFTAMVTAAIIAASKRD